MKACIYNKYGPPNVVSIGKIEQPIPTENQVLVKVFASTVNRTDAGFRSAEYVISRLFSGLFYPKNKVLGSEFSGEIVAKGKNVIDFEIGDKVFGFDDKNFGSHAEFKTIDATECIAKIPQDIDLEEAAAIYEGSHYALCDIRAAKVERGQKVLVNGATGAIGSAAVQLLRYFGAEVTAVCDTKNISLVESLGANEVLDYTKVDFTQLKQEFDFVFDAVGKSSFSKCKKILKPNGIYISTELGTKGSNVYLALFTPWFSRKKVLFPIPYSNKEDILFLKKLVEEGHFKPVIDRTYKMDDIVEAYEYIETGMKTGNVILRIG
ncbi:MAG: NAD(P)-dependent alcohol dehydrogenase [Flavobacteriales bacterium]|nr:NAD(P)-dependent alcohol dehydrogenase [Flavobacteriales bacterium]